MIKQKGKSWVGGHNVSQVLYETRKVMERNRAEEDQWLPLEAAVNKTDSVPFETKIEEESLLKEVRLHINDLPERQREILDSYYYRGQTLEVIAGHFNVTDGRIQAIKNDAIAEIRKTLWRSTQER